MGASEVPPYFLCPISLQLMKDPVTVSTGFSYDRDNILRWFSDYHHTTCPVTNQILSDFTLTPNSTLLSLIHSWLQINPPTISLPSTIPCLISELANPRFQLASLKSIRKLLEEDCETFAPIDKARTASLIVSIITTTDPFTDRSEVIEEATISLHILNPIPILHEHASKNGELVVSLSLLLQKGTYRSRVHATLILKSIFNVVDDKCKTGLPAELFDGVLEILKDQNTNRAASLAALSILLEVLPFGTNRTRAVDAGVVSVIVELLVEEVEDRRRCEAMLFVLELVCGKEEGRSALLTHSVGVTAVVEKILKVSSTATERALNVLLLLCRFCGGCGMGKEMMMVGGAAKICMVVQVESCKKTRDRASEILRMHLKEWKKFPCFPSHCFPLKRFAYYQFLFSKPYYQFLFSKHKV